MRIQPVAVKVAATPTTAGLNSFRSAAALDGRSNSVRAPYATDSACVRSDPDKWEKELTADGSLRSQRAPFSGVAGATR